MTAWPQGLAPPSACSPTNATLSARKPLALHHGRGAREAIFAGLKSQTRLDDIPRSRRAANHTGLLSAIAARDLNRELQLSSTEPERVSTGQRAPVGSFVRLDTRRIRLIGRAGRLPARKGPSR